MNLKLKKWKHQLEELLEEEQAIIEATLHTKKNHEDSEDSDSKSQVKQKKEEKKRQKIQKKVLKLTQKIKQMKQQKDVDHIDGMSTTHGENGHLEDHRLQQVSEESKDLLIPFSSSLASMSSDMLLCVSFQFKKREHHLNQQRGHSFHSYSSQPSHSYEDTEHERKVAFGKRENKHVTLEDSEEEEDDEDDDDEYDINDSEEEEGEEEEEEMPKV